MTYELAKQLKEAGFPKLTFNSSRIDDYPTLEELIEAVPDHCGLQREDFGWCIYVKGILREDTISPTPTEAVAKLYIALNKNKNQ